LQEKENIVFTPFERNLEVWRQLWRTVERSDLIVQIVDARNPLLYRSIDLEHYVKEIDHNKLNFLLINKSDLLTDEQRLAWAEYFQTQKIAYAFWSAEWAQQSLESDQTTENMMMTTTTTLPMDSIRISEREKQPHETHNNR
jgi:large subunit GTPase 1